MPEETRLEFASKVSGRMHACGHDSHTAMLVAAAQLLHRHREELPGTVKFMFQPGEEGHAGARRMSPPRGYTFSLLLRWLARPLRALIWILFVGPPRVQFT